jgi:hypothetical protein
MDEGQGYQQSQLFTIRMWPEALGEGQTEWRGQVRHVPSGETRWFREWAKLITIVQEMLPLANHPHATS